MVVLQQLTSSGIGEDAIVLIATSRTAGDAFQLFVVYATVN